jgi:hypothetical protein
MGRKLWVGVDKLMWGEGPTNRLLTSKEQVFVWQIFTIKMGRKLLIGDGKLLLGIGNGRPGLAQ